MVVEMTITEALAEIKTINARIVKKREAVMRYFSRDSRLRDPLEGDGGSKEFVRRERQAIRDLEERIVTIRSLIQAKNLSLLLMVGNENRTVAAWLNWRREVSRLRKEFLQQMADALTSVRAQAARQGQTVTAGEGTSLSEIVVAVNEQDLAKELEDLEGILGALDGKLSLFNATTKIVI